MFLQHFKQNDYSNKSRYLIAGHKDADPGYSPVPYMLGLPPIHGNFDQSRARHFLARNLLRAHSDQSAAVRALVS